MTSTDRKALPRAALFLLTALLLLLPLGACAPDADVNDDTNIADDAVDEGTAPEEATAESEMAADHDMDGMDGMNGMDADALLDPDAASREELLAVPGMDGTTADAVIAGRPYADMLEVDELLATALDEAQREEVYRHVWKRLDLNSATAAEIELIPGVGGRMRHEFEEYRPYTSMEQFRREIGKYVDDEEVARLERYVMIRDAA
jgi:DNA uptake protein ComE-like DNA-binding protein